MFSLIFYGWIARPDNNVTDVHPFGIVAVHAVASDMHKDARRFLRAPKLETTSGAVEEEIEIFDGNNAHEVGRCAS